MSNKIEVDRIEIRNIVWLYTDVMNVVDGRMACCPSGYKSCRDVVEKFIALDDKLGVGLSNESFREFALARADARDERARKIAKQIFGGK